MNSWPKMGCLLLGTMAATLLLTPWVIRIAGRLGAVDLGGYRKIHDRTIPRMGGIAIALPFFAICFAGVFQPAWIFGAGGGQEKDCLLLLVGGGIILLLGVLDDLHSLSAGHKFGFQVAVAVMVIVADQAMTGIEFPWGGILRISTISGWVLTILWIVGMINAFNLIDGLDGLATGVGMVGALGLGTIAMMNGQWAAGLLCLALAGSLAGFLCFNFHPARCFLGDTGSLFVGYVLAMLALMAPPRDSGAMILTPVLALGFPIFDTLTSMGRRVLRGRSPFCGDRAHTHHRLLDWGFSQRQIALILYGVAFLCSACAVMLQMALPHVVWLIVVLAGYELIFLGIAWVNGFLRPSHFMRVANCRERNNRLTSYSRYAALTLGSDSPTLSVQDVLKLGCIVMNLRFLAIAREGQPGLIAFGRTGQEDEEKNGTGGGNGNGHNGNGHGSNGRGGSNGNGFGGNGNGHNGNGKRYCGVCKSLRVLSAEGAPLEIRYLPNHDAPAAPEGDENAKETVKLERQDIAACLANAFSGVELNRLVLPVVDVDSLKVEGGPAAGSGAGEQGKTALPPPALVVE